MGGELAEARVPRPREKRSKNKKGAISAEL